ncbi:hypothetical protein ES288_A13G197000v1 [Gossypium darwinii]|uniref:Uncharacterized protein n=1 Tax=Gossypium darwinii TaxID=34276 RepID=A0A5D2E1S2_GOSDA|nr:hypothetical protein ES288_A13G197000v1 [Gossypium darwinii]
MKAYPGLIRRKYEGFVMLNLNPHLASITMKQTRIRNLLSKIRGSSWR